MSAGSSVSTGLPVSSLMPEIAWSEGKYNSWPAFTITIVNLSRRIELEKAANDGGFEIIEPQSDGSVMLASSDVEARLKVIADGAGFLVAVDNAGLARELTTEGRYEQAGLQSFVARRPDNLVALIRRVWQLSHALPDAPLKRFEDALAHVGEEFRTEVEASRGSLVMPVIANQEDRSKTIIQHPLNRSSRRT